MFVFVYRKTKRAETRVRRKRGNVSLCDVCCRHSNIYSSLWQQALVSQDANHTLWVWCKKSPLLPSGLVGTSKNTTHRYTLTDTHTHTHTHTHRLITVIWNIWSQCMKSIATTCLCKPFVCREYLHDLPLLAPGCSLIHSTQKWSSFVCVCIARQLVSVEPRDGLCLKGNLWIH